MATDTDPMTTLHEKIRLLEKQVEQSGTFHLVPDNPWDAWAPAIPEPYYYGLREFLGKRITGWRDEHGRAAQLSWK